MGGCRQGFSLIEVLVVVLVVGILAGIGLLKYIDVRNAARTAALASDVRAIQIAALHYYADFEQWPAESAPGQVPAGLGPYLPGGLNQSFDRPEYTLDYQNLTASGEPLIGVAVHSADPRLLAKFIATFAHRTPFFLAGGTLTYLIAGPGGVF